MATAAINDRSTPTPASAKLGWVLSGVAIIFLGTDASAKLLVPTLMAAYTPPQLRIPGDPDFYRLLGTILAFCTALYAIPRTAVFGALLLTAYLGGAVATHLIAGSPLVSETFFGVYLGIALWAGLWLREPRLRAIIPLRG
ncbi:MAG TPA: DoxX family protein [Sphingomicrobium sp.]|nr:DoxX family protein [Sphingomicrobium sp.]